MLFFLSLSLTHFILCCFALFNRLKWILHVAVKVILEQNRKFVIVIIKNVVNGRRNLNRHHRNTTNNTRRLDCSCIALNTITSDIEIRFFFCCCSCCVFVLFVFSCFHSNGVKFRFHAISSNMRYFKMMMMPRIILKSQPYSLGCFCCTFSGFSTLLFAVTRFEEKNNNNNNGKKIMKKKNGHSIISYYWKS